MESRGKYYYYKVPHAVPDEYSVKRNDKGKICGPMLTSSQSCYQLSSATRSPQNNRVVIPRQTPQGLQYTIHHQKNFHPLAYENMGNGQTYLILFLETTLDFDCIPLNSELAL